MLRTRVSCASRSVNSTAKLRRLETFKKSAATPRTRASMPSRRSARRQRRCGGGVWLAAAVSIATWLLADADIATKCDATGAAAGTFETVREFAGGPVIRHHF